MLGSRKSSNQCSVFQPTGVCFAPFLHHANYLTTLHYSAPCRHIKPNTLFFGHFLLITHSSQNHIKKVKCFKWKLCVSFPYL